MENLLPELAAMVAKFLTPRDLAACCGVSLHWREVFGSNQIWKRLCDLEKEEHLRTTPCVVEPVFTVAQDEDSALVPLSQWRLAFLREQHLWSNWRNGNFKTVQHEIETNNDDDETRFLVERFITNDFIVNFRSKSIIELWDVHCDPPIRVDSLDTGSTDHQNLDLSENGIVVLRSNSSIKILKVDVSQGTISLKYQFLSNTITLTPELICCNTPVCNATDSFSEFEVIIVKGKICIGYFCWDNSIHIWDLVSGMKLKQESYPTHYLLVFTSVFSSKTCDDVLVCVPYSFNLKIRGLKVKSLRLQCRVYDVQNLCFLSFSKTCAVLDQITGSGGNWFECAITKSFVALLDREDDDPRNTFSVIRIFNYRTDQQIYMLEGNVSVDLLRVLPDACFIFRYKNSYDTGYDVLLCSVFCSSGDVVKNITGNNIHNYFDVFGNKLIKVCPDINNRDSNEVWVINRFATFKTVVVERMLPKKIEGVNKACTKISSRKMAEGIDTIQITNFW